MVQHDVQNIGRKRDFRTVTPEAPLEMPSGQRLHYTEDLAVIGPEPERAPYDIVPFAGDELKEQMTLIRNNGMTEQQAISYFTDYAEKSHLGEFSAAAYSAPSGVAIRVNPHTGLKEAFIAGTRGPLDWGRNIIEGADSIVSAGLHKVTNIMPKGELRNKAEAAANVLENVSVPGRISKILTRSEGEELAETFREEGVQVIYGHSRAGAILQYFPEEEFTTIALDGANIVGHDPMSAPNFSSDDIFSRTIGIGSRKRVELPGRSFHKAWETKAKKAKADKKAEDRKKSKLGVPLAELKKEFYEQADKATRRQHMKLVERAKTKIGKKFAANLAKYIAKQSAETAIKALPGGSYLPIGQASAPVAAYPPLPRLVEGDLRSGTVVPYTKKRNKKKMTSARKSKYARLNDELPHMGDID
ncbi:hypothetical protein [Protobacilladnavirus tenuis]|uniref:Uncharacterized protein n=1 Tax=Protobacilladnavirus tenuis TaxID=3052706 RepID=E3WH27_9VIRU|nr:hypothetical protein [Protobacilladnavirus tenuis]BAJ40165.1 hypothetical protein [Protobacilladnavirus tenuis]